MVEILDLHTSFFFLEKACKKEHYTYILLVQKVHRLLTLPIDIRDF